MARPAPQTEIAAWLHKITQATPVETHISAVFVGATDVYKLKKSIKLPFLDFSTLAARRAMALRELALNRTAAPGIYRDVLSIRRGAGGALCFGPANAPDALDYVIHMAPVPACDFLDVIMANGAPDGTFLDALGDCVAALHATMPPVTLWDSAGNLRRTAEENAVAARAAGLDPALVDTWLGRWLAACGRIADTLQARAAAGFVRRAHGDLHLGNICVWHGRPTAFDALEFDEAMATIDTGYDLAFLLMDLEHKAGEHKAGDHTAGRAAANRVMNRYIARTGDAGLLAGMPIFLSMRAMIRAHVQHSRGAIADAARYLQTAMTALHPTPPTLVAIGGLQGTGKSTLARALAPSLGRPPGALHLRSDEIRKRLHGQAPEQKLPPEAYTPAANARVNACVIETANIALSAGQAVIADTTFLHPPLRHSIEATAKTHKIPFLGIWLETGLATALARVTTRTNDASDAGPGILRAAAALNPGHITWHHIDATHAAAALRDAQALLGGAGCSGAEEGQGVPPPGPPAGLGPDPLVKTRS